MWTLVKEKLQRQQRTQQRRNRTGAKHVTQTSEDTALSSADFNEVTAELTGAGAAVHRPDSWFQQ